MTDIQVLAKVAEVLQASVIPPSTQLSSLSLQTSLGLLEHPSGKDTLPNTTSDNPEGNEGSEDKREGSEKVKESDNWRWVKSFSALVTAKIPVIKLVACVYVDRFNRVVCVLSYLFQSVSLSVSPCV